MIDGFNEGVHIETPENPCPRMPQTPIRSHVRCEPLERVSEKWSYQRLNGMNAQESFYPVQVKAEPSDNSENSFELTTVTIKQEADDQDYYQFRFQGHAYGEESNKETEVDHHGEEYMPPRKKQKNTGQILPIIHPSVQCRRKPREFNFDYIGGLSTAL
ncbi:unnamed protein product [Ranitomeya imitator]|uniref:Uncharacterized protein n=1 Tax=Ranitomeya imitator TaxID=111125 RepID=A0ABN9MPC1_9NEOB|nr:unnamed protein product [Ranitomeya imitator]